MIDPTEFGKAMGVIVREATAPLLRRIEELESRQLAKGDPISVSEVAAELLAADGLKALVDLHVAEAVAELPKPQDGAQGPQGEPGAKGDPGADGVGLAGAVIDREGAAILTLTNGETRSLGVIVGKDGADFSEVEFDYDGERGLIIRGKGGELVKRLPIPIDRGYWSEGKSFERGDVTTHDGTVFIALRDTKSKPCKENAEDWRIMCRKGRDGKDGRNGIDKTGPVKV